MAGSRGGAYDDYEYWRCEVGPIWIRSAPCHDSERVGYEKAGALVASRGRVGDWIEVVGGGYMMHDGREKRLGQLLRRLRGDEEFAAKLQQVKRDALAESMRAETQSTYDVRAEIDVYFPLAAPPVGAGNVTAILVTVPWPANKDLFV